MKNVEYNKLVIKEKRKIDSWHGRSGTVKAFILDHTNCQNLMIFVSESNFCYNLNVYVKKKINLFYVFVVVEFSRKIRDGQPVNGGSCALSLIAHY